MSDPKRVNICGTFGFLDDLEGEVWGLNSDPTRMTKYQPTAWFQMHPREQWEGGRNGDPSWLFERHGFPVYMLKKHKYVPASRAYPRARAEALWPKALGLAAGPIFSDTFCYMIALAILQGYEHIHLSGVFLSNDIEAFTEAPAVAMWAMLAATRGILVSDNCRLLEPFRYGYEPRRPAAWLPASTAWRIMEDEDLEGRATRSRLGRLLWDHEQRSQEWYAERRPTSFVS